MSNKRQTFGERLRLYGLRGTVGQALRALVRVAYRVDRNIVFVIPGFAGCQLHDSSIKPFTAEELGRAALRNGFCEFIVCLVCCERSERPRAGCLRRRWASEISAKLEIYGKESRYMDRYEREPRPIVKTKQK